MDCKCGIRLKKRLCPIKMQDKLVPGYQTFNIPPRMAETRKGVGGLPYLCPFKRRMGLCSCWRKRFLPFRGGGAALISRGSPCPAGSCLVPLQLVLTWLPFGFFYGPERINTPKGQSERAFQDLQNNFVTLR